MSEIEKRNYFGLFYSLIPAMLEKLYENKHKKGWENIDFEYASNRILDEYRELKEAIIDNDIKEIRREAADIANFAAMIIYQCDKKLKEEER
jgi:DNA-binding FadR family transcriptional regulator